MTVTETSREAYESIKPQLGQKQERLLNVLQQYGPCTDKGLSALLGWPINTITPRRGELVSLQLVRDCGHITRDGRQATMWQTTK